MEAESQTSNPVEETTVEETQVETPETEVVEAASTEETASETATEEVVQPEYQADYKFKVHGEEKEFDDWAKALVKDKDSEEFYRDILTKVHGLDHVKQDREALKTQVDQYTPIVEQYNGLSEQLKVWTDHLNTGNYDAFFKQIGVKENDIFNWVSKRLAYNEMDPMQKAEYDKNVMAQEQAVLMGHQNQQLSTEMEQVRYERRMLELDTYLSKPEYSRVAQEYDAQRGAPGAFRQEVQNRGVFHHATAGKDITVDQAVNEVMTMLGKAPVAVEPAQAPAMTGQAPNEPSVAAPQAPGEKPVIPNVKGTGLSATKQTVRSLDDVRRLRDARS